MDYATRCHKPTVCVCECYEIVLVQSLLGRGLADIRQYRQSKSTRTAGSSRNHRTNGRMCHGQQTLRLLAHRPGIQQNGQICGHSGADRRYAVDTGPAAAGELCTCLARQDDRRGAERNGYNLHDFFPHTRPPDTHSHLSQQNTTPPLRLWSFCRVSGTPGEHVLFSSSIRDPW